jgi:hypothetical protein
LDRTSGLPMKSTCAETRLDRVNPCIYSVGSILSGAPISFLRCCLATIFLPLCPTWHYGDCNLPRFTDISKVSCCWCASDPYRGGLRRAYFLLSLAGIATAFHFWQFGSLQRLKC